VAAVGVPGLITAEMVRPGATVVDVGITRVVGEDGKGRYTGDVDPGVREIAGALVPVPGGIGPMTRAMLLTNVVERAEWLTSR
jgi:methylenetetrahydrofolate dehydrogenase (NADP+)/methenyltetrahydrofolate cyclohydrolase